MKKIIERLPSAWTENSLKDHNMFLRRGKSPEYCENNQGLLVINQDCIRWNTIDLSKVKFHVFPGRIDDTFFLRPGDILINSTGTGTIGRVNQWPYSDIKAIADSHVTVLRVKEKSIDNKYARYFLASELGQRYLEAVCYTGSTNQIELSKRYLSKMKLPCPPLREQKAIAGILSKVDEAIEAVENNIKAAEKLKKSLMQNLLTGKLKPDGNLRNEDDFYVDDKFGKVPKGWKVKPVGDQSLCNINPNYSFIKGERYDFIPMDAINDEFRGVGYLDSKIVDGGGYTRFRKGDILFAKITPCTENGKVALVEKMNSIIGFASTEFIIFQPKETIDNLFYFYLLSSDRVHNLSVSLMEGTTGRQRVPWKVFKKRILAPIPVSLDEQIDIAERLKTIEYSSLSKKAKIQSLNTLKKSLMQNLLTGRVRIDVEKINKLLEDV